MLKVNKHHLRSVYLTASLSNHSTIKHKLLKLFQQSDHHEISGQEGTDNITKLDWNFNEDMERPWATQFLNDVVPTIDLMVNEIGFSKVKILQLWYQQYTQSDTHNWHSHSCNFTGVYYLELPDDAPKTQIIDPLTQAIIITPDVKEGDLLLFPSYTIHRAPRVLTDTRKTIISFNFDLKHFTMNCYAGLAAAEFNLVNNQT